MADYWKSQARKFCDFCKCWIADNKPSIQFHENGKRHKENVAAKLSLLTKRSVKEKKKSLKVDEEMKKMEEAAMKAYMKDMESNPDFTSKVIMEKVEEKKKTLEMEQKKHLEESAKINEPLEKEQKTNLAKPSNDSSNEKVWHEALSNEGYTYYWNYLTGESVWEPPKEGYISISEQQILQSNSDENDDSNDKVSENKVQDNKNKEIEQKDNKKRKKEVEDDDIEESTGPVIGPSVKPDPYGGWKTIERVVEEPIDLQLPQQELVEINVPTLEYEQPQIKFKEKTITNLSSDDGPSTFKKRKFRGNVRKKCEDDDNI